MVSHRSVSSTVYSFARIAAGSAARRQSVLQRLLFRFCEHLIPLLKSDSFCCREIYFVEKDYSVEKDVSQRRIAFKSNAMRFM